MLCRGSNVNIKTYHAHKQKVFKFDESQIIPDILFDENLHLKENFSQKLYASSSVTLLEAVFQHFHVFSTNNGMSKSAMSNALQTEKSHLPQPNSLPPTFKEAKSLIKPLLMPLQKYDACINDCILFRSCDNGNYSDLASCPICQEPRKVKNSSQKVFHYMPIAPRLNRWFGTSNLCKLLYANKVYSNGKLCDFTDSNVYKNWYTDQGVFGDHEEQQTVPLALFTDGVNPNKHLSTQKSMWPLLLTWINLPVQIRQLLGPMLLVGIIPSGRNGSEPKSLEPYIDLLVDEILKLSEFPTYNSYRKAPVKVKVALLQFLCDIPAYSKLLHISGHSGLRSCGYCKETGIYCKHLSKTIHLSNRQFLPENHPLRSSNRFSNGSVELKQQPVTYTNEEERHLREIFDNKPNRNQQNNFQKATGLKGKYSIMKLPYHDRNQQMQPDGMHTIADFISHVMDLLVGKSDTKKVRLCEKHHQRFPQTWPQETAAEQVAIEPPSKKRKTMSSETLPPAPWTLSTDSVKEADRRATAIKYPAGVEISPGLHFTKPWTLRTMNSKLQFVKTGALQWCIKGLLPKRQETTLFTVLEVIVRMTQQEFEISEIKQLQDDTHAALALLERDFPLSLQNLVTHLLHHIVDGIAENGPLYGRWLFPYERANGWMSRQGLKKGGEEATIMETYVIYDWCVYMMLSQKMMPATSNTNSISNAAAFVREKMSNAISTDSVFTSIGRVEEFQIPCYLQEQMKNFDNTISSSMPSFAKKIHSLVVSNKSTLHHNVRYNGVSSQMNKRDSSFVSFLNKQNKVCIGRIAFLIEHNFPSEQTRYWAVVHCLQNCSLESGLWKGQGFSASEFIIPLHTLSDPLVTSELNGYIYVLNLKS
ncbi:uncharacterized protein [Mytilus edulis]|uniref:uncharacterized protein n=1 Tax=Mytilus edulis TaxID=6550 RepID=UPI0039EDFBBE